MAPQPDGASLPQPGPEAVLVRRARLAKGLTIERAVAAAAAVFGPDNVIKPVRWSQIETGRQLRRGSWVPSNAPDGTLAQMAYVVDITPEQLTATGRGEAAEILRHMIASHGTRPVLHDEVERSLWALPIPEDERWSLIQHRRERNRGKPSTGAETGQAR